MRIKVVGLGGIGTHLIVPLCRFLNGIVNTREEINIVFIDGDEFKPKNFDRQEFNVLGNKAIVTTDRIKSSFPHLRIESKPHYIAEENIFLFIEEGDIVFSCVDNHATRRLLSGYCQTLQDIVLISGGNEYTDGNIQVYVRKKGKDVTSPLTYLHPEIADPKDRNPTEMSCEELSKNGAPQLIFTNFMTAAWMLSVFWLITKNNLKYSEQYFDLETGMARSVRR